MSLFVISSLHADIPQWTVLIYMHAPTFLKEPSYAALEALSQGIAERTNQHNKLYARDQKMLFMTPRVQILVEIHTDEYITRFSYDDLGKCHLVSQAHVKDFEDHEHDLYAACQWAFGGFPSEHTCLILSGHGTGILEPQWHEGTQRWLFESGADDSYFDRYRVEQNERLIQLIDERLFHTFHRSLFLPSQRKPMNVCQIGRIIKKVAQHLLGRKIDILGFDACHMALLEIAYEVSFAAHFMVASQNCEEKEGWDYKEVASAFSFSSPSLVAQALVHAYAKKEQSQQKMVLNLSAFDLAIVPQLMQALDKAVNELCACLMIYKKEFHDQLCSIRAQCKRFCSMPAYTDLSEFLYTLLQETLTLPAGKARDDMRLALYQVLEILAFFIVAYTSSEYPDTAQNILFEDGMPKTINQGVSIYFPLSHQEAGYQKTSFAQVSAWPRFLAAFIG